MLAVSHQATEWVWKHSPFTGATLLVHLAIARAVGPDNLYAAPVPELAAETRCSERSVVTALSGLTDDGQLQQIEPGGGRGKPSRYRLVMRETLQSATGKPRNGFTEKSAKPRNERTLSSRARGLPALELQGQEIQTHVELKLDVKSSVEEVFSAWQESTGKAKAVLDSKRKRLIENALRSHGLRDVLDAVRGWKNSPFHRGENERGKPYNDLELVLRDAQHIEEMRDLARDGAPKAEEWRSW